MRVFLASIPEITVWLVVGASLGFLVGLALVMVSLRWMFPWQELHQLRQGPRGWLWICIQWCWVGIWGVSLPLLVTGSGGLTGAAIAARNLVLRENVGQVLGEKILSPIAEKIALQMKPHWGDLASSKLELRKVRTLLDEITPELLETTLNSVTMLDEKDNRAGPMEQSARRFARQAIQEACHLYLSQKTRFIDRLIQELQVGHHNPASLRDIVCCASQLYFTPAFATWTLWWILAQAGTLLPIIALLWLSPWLLFQLYWKLFARKSLTTNPS